MSLNSVTQLIFVMVKCGVFFAVRTEFLNMIYTSFGFSGLSLQTYLNYEILKKANRLSSFLSMCFISLELLQS
jgi:hypothetical protein